MASASDVPGAHDPLDCAPTGIPGLDAILHGGLPRNYVYLLHGPHGAGKTTLGLQFCLAGLAAGERVMYLSTTESAPELRQIAESHGWSLDGLQLHYHDPREFVGPQTEQSVFPPVEVELPRAFDALLTRIDQVAPQRLVIDSLAEIRMLADAPRWYRRQMLALRERLADCGCTAIFCDQAPDTERPVQSVVHGVIQLDVQTPEFGPDRRRLRIVKVRGMEFQSGYHDCRIARGGLQVFPRLVAKDWQGEFPSGDFSSGSKELDRLLGGGLDRGAATLLQGPTGTGKSTVASQFVLAAAERGEASVVYAFDERKGTFVRRATQLGMDLQPALHRGLIEIEQIDPAAVSLGEFSCRVRRAVEQRQVKLVVLDSLAGYGNTNLAAGQLTLYLRELLACLCHQGVTTLVVAGQHGEGSRTERVAAELGHVVDVILDFHFFEHGGELRRAISVSKRRAGPHEQTLRELQIGPQGIRVGGPLRDFRGIVSGMLRFVGKGLPHVDSGEPS